MYSALDAEDQRRRTRHLEEEKRSLDVADAATRASLKRSLAQLDADARELIDFTVWNFTAFTKITKKGTNDSKREPAIRERFTTLVKNRDCCAATLGKEVDKRRPPRYADLFCGGEYDRSRTRVEGSGSCRK